MRKTLKQLLADYGRVALGVYVTIFLFVLAGSWTAVRLGWQPESATGDMGALAAAYLFTKLTQPLRIAATLLFTPLVAKVQERLAGNSGPSAPDGDRSIAQMPPAAELRM
jgi:hypothetical protein